MSPAFEKMVAPAPGDPDATGGLPEFKIAVVFTSADATLAALKRAGAMAGALGCQITLVVPQVVPYPLPLTSPPILLDWNESRFRTVASKTAVETRVALYLCRDRLEALTSVLDPGSVVFVGSRKRWWWPMPEKRLARKLSNAGHLVVLTEME